MNDFDTIEEMFIYMEQGVESALRTEGSKMGVKVVKDDLDDKLYSMPESDYHVRTGELRNSVISIFDDKFAKSSKRNEKRITIDHDTSQTFMPSGHRSWVNDSIQNKNIPMWINEGHKGVLANPFIGINYFESSFQKISDQIIPTMIKGLRRFGIDGLEII